MPLLRERRRELNDRIAAAKTGIADPALQRMVAEIDNFTSTYFATLTRSSICGQGRTTCSAPDGAEAERICSHFTEIKDVSAADGSHAASFAASEAKEHWLLARRSFPVSSPVATAPPGHRSMPIWRRLRTHLGQLDGVLKNPQLRKSMTGLTEDIRAYFADFQEVVAFTQEAARLRDDMLVALAEHWAGRRPRSPNRRRNRSELALEDGHGQGQFRTPWSITLILGIVSILIGIIAAQLVARSITNPINALRKVMTDLTEGDLAVTVPYTANATRSATWPAPWTR